MIRSMTGYARAEQQGPWGRLTWEMRSVNHRYLDLQIKLPEEFRSVENELRTQAGAQVGRGKVEAGLRFSAESTQGKSVEVDAEQLHAVKAALNLVARELGSSSSPDPMRVLSYPGVVKSVDALSTAPVAEAVALFKQALQEFTDARSREGERLASYIAERCQQLAALVKQVRIRSPLVRDAWAERLRARCRDLGVDVDPARLAQEVAIVAQRLDVDEEMSRLASHLVEVRDALARGEAIGRRLDFLMQELNREANTLSSKSQDAEMTRSGVEMKVLIEQMREQVQNIE